MPKPSSPSAAAQAAYRRQLLTALLLVCRKIRRLQPAADAKAACDEVARSLRALRDTTRRPRRSR